jgi:hypothetical protein
MSDYDYERMESHMATPSEACREYAANYGADHPERAWILTDYDSWERNPHYHGPSVPHPEDDTWHDSAYDRSIEG